MYVTKNNVSILHDALLALFDADSFMVLSSWGEIGFKNKDGSIKSLLTGNYTLERIYCNTLADIDENNPCTIYCGYAASIGHWAKCFHRSIDEIKLIVVREVIKHIKRNDLSIADFHGLYNLYPIKFTKTYEQFLIESELNMIVNKV